MARKVAIFWPGDYRAKPNEWALPQSRETTEQLVAALKKLGQTPYVVYSNRLTLGLLTLALVMMASPVP